MEFIVGPGIEAAMRARGDLAVSNEVWTTGPNTPGDAFEYSSAYGASSGACRQYVYVKSLNQVFVSAPLEAVDGPRPKQRFTVWNGVAIRHERLAEIADAVKGLAPADHDWDLVWSPKAGEGGTWQATWDASPLAIRDAEHLRALRGEMAALGVELAPYVVIRGRPAWNEAEWQQVKACADICDRVILNLENGSDYWNGPTDPETLARQYLEPLHACGVPREKLQLTAIPRQGVVDDLGGAATMRMWLEHVASASWECYGNIAEDLEPEVALKRVDAWLPEGAGPEYRIPLVQRSMIERSREQAFVVTGMSVWHLDGVLLLPEKGWPQKAQKEVKGTLATTAS